MIIKEYAKEEIKSRLDYLSPAAFMILCDVIIWSIQRQINLVISDAVSDLSEDMALNRVSSTHREGRAFDISTRDWKKDDVDDCISFFAAKYRYIAAVGDDNEPRLCVFHNAGTGDHIHFQVHKRYAMPLKQFNSIDAIKKMS